MHKIKTTSGAELKNKNLPPLPFKHSIIEALSDKQSEFNNDVIMVYFEGENPVWYIYTNVIDHFQLTKYVKPLDGTQNQFPFILANEITEEEWKRLKLAII